MQLSEKQLKVQQRADKTLSFGCIYRRWEWYETIYPDPNTWFDENGELWETWQDYGLYENSDNDYLVPKDMREIIWHPMTRWRLCYLWLKWLDKDIHNNARSNMMDYMENNIDIFQQTVIEWDEKFTDLVLAFLETLPKE